MDVPGTATKTIVAKAVLVAVLGFFGLWIASSFLPALIWSTVSANANAPLYVRAERRWPHHGNLLAALVTLAFALLVVVPIIIGITRIAGEAYEVMAWISAARTNGIPAPSWLHDLPFGQAAVMDWWQMNLATPEGATQHLHHLSGATLIANSRLIGSGLLHRVIIFAFTLIALFFLLRDREVIIRQYRIASDRLLGPAAERIGRQAVRSVRGTIDGLVLVGLGEGAVMTVVYALIGVPHALLLGALTGVAAIIPFGAALLFAVAAVLLLGQGSVLAAIAVVVIGLIVVGIADHFVRPVLIGSATRLPFLWVLIGILGGVETFGLLGLFVGPATMAVLVLLWREYLEGPDAESSATTLDASPPS
jgi:predicted PurR-regulated permease PerM